MRHWSGIVLVACFAVVAPQTLRAILSSAVSVLFEALPYLVAAAMLTPLAGRHARALIAYAGCGCATGPAARSIPAAFATAALFGPLVACARVVVATLVARVHPTHEHADSNMLAELIALVPAALLAATVMQFAPALPLHAAHPVVLWIAGALLGIVVSPCALGGVALAAALRATAPFAAIGVLCTAGIMPQPRIGHVQTTHDPLAYLLLAASCTAIAANHGGTLVHPRMTFPLALCAIYCAILAWRHRDQRARAPRTIAVIVLAIVVIGAPQPMYRATETTLADAFAGEHVDFTGVAVADRARSVLVRYAITCCRADAAPVALVVDRDLAPLNGRWLRARGTIEADGDALRLRVAQLTPIAPPSDPFVYR